MTDAATSPEDQQNPAELEREWIRLTRLGDQEAFSNLVRTHQARLRAFAARYVYSGDDVHDLVQEAFINAFEHIDRFDIERDFGRWLRGICRNRILKYFREVKTRNKRMDSIVAMLENRLDEEATFDQDAHTERIKQLRTCIDELKGSHRELIHMRYYMEMSVTDIGRMVGKKASAVSVQLMRIRHAIKDRYESQVPQGTS